MADFQTHITTSTVVGVAYGAVGHFGCDFSVPTACLGGGLCALAGMLPDLDSDSGVPLRETLSFAAAVVPMLMLERWIALGFTPEMIAMAGGLTYLAIRFGVGGFLRNYTVHRGMFHSWPAVLIAGLVAFLVCESLDLPSRYFKAGAVMLGYLTHLVLDEIWAVEWNYGIPRFKKSFGTALKFVSDKTWSNISTYGKLVILTYLAFQDPIWMDQLSKPDAVPQFVRQIRETQQTAADQRPRWWR